MPALGTPSTNKYLIGTFEVRVGPMNKAGRLQPKHSVGIVEGVTVNFEANSVDLLAGFPQQAVDTAVTSLVTGFEVNFREYSRRNLNLLLGNGVADYPTAGGDATGVVDTTSLIAANATTINLTSLTGALTAGDTVVIYEVGNPGSLTVSIVDSYAAGPPKVVTLETGLGLANGFAQDAVVHIYKADPISIGNITGVNYFSAQLVQVDRGTNRPLALDVWKAALSGGTQAQFSVTDFASGTMPFKALQPSAADLAGALAHQAAVIPSYPTARWIQVPDVL